MLSTGMSLISSFFMEEKGTFSILVAICLCMCVKTLCKCSCLLSQLLTVVMSEQKTLCHKRSLRRSLREVILKKAISFGAHCRFHPYHHQKK